MMVFAIMNTHSSNTDRNEVRDRKQINAEKIRKENIKHATNNYKPPHETVSELNTVIIPSSQLPLANNKTQNMPCNKSVLKYKHL